MSARNAPMIQFGLDPVSHELGNMQRQKIIQIIGLLLPALVFTLGGCQSNRNILYDNLARLERSELFPEEFKTQEAFAESDMVNWLVYLTELGKPPDEIQLMKVVEVDTGSEDGVVEFYLFRFRSAIDGMKDDGWMAGVSGYYKLADKPTTEAHGYTFSAFEKWRDKTPEQHVSDIRSLLNRSN